METFFITSQILAGISLVLSVISVQVKNGRSMRTLMTFSAILRGTHFLLLGAPQAAWITYLTGVRWFSSIFTKKKILMLIFILSMLIIGFYNYQHPIDILPIVSGILGTLAAFSTSNRYMRVYIIIAMVLWVIHNIVIFTPVGIASSIFFLISNIIGYERFYHHKHVCLYNC